MVRVLPVSQAGVVHTQAGAELSSLDQALGLQLSPAEETSDHVSAKQTILSLPLATTDSLKFIRLYRIYIICK